MDMDIPHLFRRDTCFLFMMSIYPKRWILGGELFTGTKRFMSIYRDRIGLLITSCVKPPENVYFLNIVDENERRRQYVESVEYYIKRSPFDKLIYCDNSLEAPSENLIKLATDHKKELEWMSFRGDEDKCVKKGKGVEITACLRFLISFNASNTLMISIPFSIDFLQNISTTSSE